MICSHGHYHSPRDKGFLGVYTVQSANPFVRQTQTSYVASSGLLLLLLLLLVVYLECDRPCTTETVARVIIHKHN